MTPVFGHGALRLYLLSLLAEAPRHGYELMQALEQRFGGTYSPSAGTIYPRLSKLEEEGLVTKTADGRRTTYEITDAGREELRAREGELHTLEGEITDSVRRLASDVREGVKSAMQTLRAELAAAERDARSSTRRSSDTSGSSGSSGTSGPNVSSGWAEPSASATPSAPQSAAPEWPEGSAPFGDHWASQPKGSTDGSTDRSTDGSTARSTDVSTDRSTDVSHTAMKVAARMAVHDVDLALSDFRQQVREAVRRDRAAHMTTAKAATVRSELEAALLRIKSVL